MTEDPTDPPPGMGRKAWIAVYTLSSINVLTFAAMLFKVPIPDSAFGALAFVAGTFMGANAAIGYQVAKTNTDTNTNTNTTNTQITKQITDRRDSSAGMEAT